MNEQAYVRLYSYQPLKVPMARLGYVRYQNRMGHRYSKVAVGLVIR